MKWLFWGFVSGALVTIAILVKVLLKRVNIYLAKKLGNQLSQKPIPKREHQRIINELQKAKTDLEKLKILKRELDRLKNIH